MLFTCTANSTDGAVEALSACCPKNVSSDVNPTCQTQKVDDLAHCLQQRGQWIDTCVVGGLKVHTSQNDQLPSSAIALPRPKLSLLALVTLGLALLGTVTAAVPGEGVQCNKFTPSNRTEWRTDHATQWTPVSKEVTCPGPPFEDIVSAAFSASMSASWAASSAAAAHTAVDTAYAPEATMGSGGSTSTNGTTYSPCPVSTDTGAAWRASFSSPNAIKINVDIAEVVKLAGKGYAGAARLDQINAKFYVAPGHTGVIRAWAGAVTIPGSFDECTDGKRYSGEAVVLDPSRIGVSLVQKH